MTQRPSLTRYAWLSLTAAVATVTLKLLAYAVTGSVGLLSDALESLVNVLAGGMALAMLKIAERPPDEEHPYGHTKAEYFSSGLEGLLILAAALGIGWTAWRRLLAPLSLDQPAVGLVIVVIATLINFVVAQVLVRAGRRHDSITLEANARHLMTDVWTSTGVVLGVGLVAVTGWLRLDALIAIAVALHIVVTGFDLMRRSALGMLDTAIGTAEQERVGEVLRDYQSRGIAFHAVRTRQAGGRRFVSLHVLVPGDWTVLRGHELLEEVEAAIRSAIPAVTVFTHLEPLEDPASWEDLGIERVDPAE
ncbi:MAG TPA: cation diffusion facilitator family transporter [Longimicrobiales bacterium]|nr:cation diffusion facilitator family transporter [Longimicrobiales bacterium]